MKNLNKMTLCVLIVLLILSLTCGNAQEAPRDSIFLHPDGSVTFLYQNPDAKSVKVELRMEPQVEDAVLKEDPKEASRRKTERLERIGLKGTGSMRTLRGPGGR